MRNPERVIRRKRRRELKMWQLERVGKRAKSRRWYSRATLEFLKLLRKRLWVEYRPYDKAFCTKVAE